eukprot:452804_1
MSFLPVEQDEDVDSRSRQNDDNESIRNSVNLLKSLKDVKVQNVCGSTAGAGSGTFHKYRQAKRREQFRLEQLNKEHKLNKMNQRIKKRKRENDAILEKKRNKKRKLRQKKKLRRQKAAEATQTNKSNHNQNQDSTKEHNHQHKTEIDQQKNCNELSANDDDNPGTIEQELEELINIDKQLANIMQKQEEKVKKQSDDLNETTVKKSEEMQNETDKNKTNTERNQQAAIMAALAAEFGD